MLLIILLILVTIAISGTAAFFSVYGLAHIFTTAFIPSIIMGASLEAGKLVIASFLYQFWNKIGVWFKGAIFSLIAGLMLFTSIGIFGYLTAAYQSGSIELNDNKQRVEFLTQEKTNYENRLVDINLQIQNVPAQYVSKKIELIKTLNAEKKDILDKLNTVSEERSKLMTTQLQSEAKVGPIIFVANALNKPVENSITYLVIFIMLIFDPLAMVMTIATNTAIANRKKVNTKTEDTVTPPSIEKNVDVSNTEVLTTILNKLNIMSDAVDKTNKRQQLNASTREI